MVEWAKAEVEVWDLEWGGGEEERLEEEGVGEEFRSWEGVWMRISRKYWEGEERRGR